MSTTGRSSAVMLPKLESATLYSKSATFYSKSATFYSKSATYSKASSPDPTSEYLPSTDPIADAELLARLRERFAHRS